MHYLAFWQSGLVLAAIPVVHWIWLRRGLGVSGRYTALIDGLRAPANPAADVDMNQAELVAALRAATVEAFGADALEPVPEAVALAEPTLRAPERPVLHLLFFVGLCAGGLLSAALRGGWSVSASLRSELFPRIFGHSPLLGSLVLLFGGVLVGFGTRISGGCTSGHGLCGVSQLQKGSLLATAAFFGVGVITSFALRALL